MTGRIRLQLIKIYSTVSEATRLMFLFCATFACYQFIIEDFCSPPLARVKIKITGKV